MSEMGIKKNDQVVVIAGKDKGKTGKVLRIVTKSGRALVEKVNMVKRHQRPSAKTGKGGILEKESPVHLSNLMVVCSKCGKPTRMGRRVLEDGSKARFCRKCKEVLDA